MNIPRVAAALRELADALEEPARVRPRRKPRAPEPETQPRPELVAQVRRTVRRKGIAA